MRLSRKTRSLVAAIMSLSLVLPSVALAGGGHSYGHGDRHSGGYGKGHGKGRHHGDYRKPHYKHHGGGHYYRGRHGKHVTKYKYEYDNDNENLLIGLLVGGLVGYAIGDSQSSGSQQYYAPAAPPREVYSTTPYNTVDGDGTCLQEREYTNKVIVGGKTVDAYGTACLQPDGSWRYGPSRLASF
ncbi:MAG: hypothetical protein JSU75_11355 [Gammaproteobacteria bacterium]|nr:MAG: hypothetical protein JSU75_11355 [Gammaproteobacteria bacterium]